MENIYSLISSNSKSVLFLLLFVTCLILFVAGKEKVLKEVFVWPSIIMLVLIFNPFVTGFVETKFANTSIGEAFDRFILIMPIAIALAIGFGFLISKQKSHLAIAGTLLLTTLVCFLLGGPQVTFASNSNVYKIPNHVVSEAEMILNDYGTYADVDNAEYGEINVMMDDESFFYLMTYDGRIASAAFYYSIYPTASADMEIPEDQTTLTDEQVLALITYYDVQLEPEVVQRAFDDYDVDYLTIKSDWYSEDYMSAAGLYFVGAEDGYAVYRFENN